jgi:hypothetical protein
LYCNELFEGLFEGLYGKKFLGHLKKNIVQRNLAEKKILASNWGMKKNSCTEKLPNPPLKNLMSVFCFRVDPPVTFVTS